MQIYRGAERLKYLSKYASRTRTEFIIIVTKIHHWTTCILPTISYFIMTRQCCPAIYVLTAFPNNTLLSGIRNVFCNLLVSLIISINVADVTPIYLINKNKFQTAFLILLSSSYHSYNDPCFYSSSFYKIEVKCNPLCIQIRILV